MPEMLSWREIRERNSSWTDSHKYKFLAVPDEKTSGGPCPHCRATNKPLGLYSLERVKGIEESREFEEHTASLKRRPEDDRITTEKRSQNFIRAWNKALRTVEHAPIHIKRVKSEELPTRAAAYYNKFRIPKSPLLDPSVAETDFLECVELEFIRDCLVVIHKSADETIDLFMYSGADDLRRIVESRIYDRIRSLWPHLNDKCREVISQIRNWTWWNNNPEPDWSKFL